MNSGHAFGNKNMLLTSMPHSSLEWRTIFLAQTYGTRLGVIAPSSKSMPFGSFAVDKMPCSGQIHGNISTPPIPGNPASYPSTNATRGHS
jgi:hypothetical protein